MYRPDLDHSRADEVAKYIRDDLEAVAAKYIRDDLETVAEAFGLWEHTSRRRRTNKRAWEIFETDVAREQRLAEAQEQSRKFKEKITKKRSGR